ncbi:MAG: S8 family serine peptidase, partial [Candidatus Heimdallarchaeota archaeon]
MKWENNFLRLILFCTLLFIFSSGSFQIIYQQVNATTNSMTSEQAVDSWYLFNSSRNSLNEFFKQDFSSDALGIEEQSPSFFESSSESLEPFYYLDPNLRDYYDLAKCHDYASGIFGSEGYTGEGITICVIDTGVAYNHSYFSAGYNSLIETKVIVSVDGTARNPSSSDYDDHATKCVSSIKQIAPKAKIISLSCPDFSDKNLILGTFQWIYNHFENRHIKIVSMSLNKALEDIPDNSDDIKDLILQLSGNTNFGSTGATLIEERRVIFSFSAGNKPYGSSYGYAVRWPANLGNYMNIYGVGVSNFNNIRDKPDEIDSIQNTDSVIRLNCQAPGKDLQLASYNEGTGNETIVISSGSSYSAPMVAGALALAYEKYGISDSLALLITCKYTTSAGNGDIFGVNDNPFHTINLQPNEFKDTFGFSNYTNVKQYYGFGILNIPGILNISDIDEDGLTDFHELYYSSGFDFLDPWNPDTDGDGMLDGWEHKYYHDFGNGTSIFNPLIPAIGSGLYENEGDPDLDGLVNMLESQAGSNPFVADTDTDGLTWIPENGKITSDPTKIDSDQDNLTDLEEVTGTVIDLWIVHIDGYPLHYNNYNVITDPMNNDTDSDELSDFAEVTGVDIWTFANSTKILVSNIQLHPLYADRDGDLISDGLEVNGITLFLFNLTFYCDPRLGDTDTDDISDRLEVYNYFTDPLDKDSDNDNIIDGEEIILGNDGYITNPNNADTDNDNVNDDDEIFGIYLPNSENANASGYIFLDPTDDDSDNDSIKDGEELTSGTDGYITDPTDQDTDNDGLGDDDEINDYLTDPTDTDTDDDSLQDWDELYYYITDPTNDDSDLDLLKDGDEVFIYFTDPN